MIHRGRFEEIIFEYSLAEDSHGTIILCDGLPTVPKRKELMEFLNSEGFDVIYPRYRGTWESGDEFLVRSPADDISELMAFLAARGVSDVNNELRTEMKSPVYAVGSSFGGTVALALSREPVISGVVSFSPIVDFKSHGLGIKEQDLLALGEFIKAAYGNGYRFTFQNWKRLLAGEVFNAPEQIAQQVAEKIVIVSDPDDQSVSHEKIINYAERNRIGVIDTSGIGHLSFSKIPRPIWVACLDFLKRKV